MAEVVREYYEVQDGRQCGVHAVNNAFGREVLTTDGVAALIDEGRHLHQYGQPRPWWWDEQTAGLEADARGHVNRGSFWEAAGPLGNTYCDYSSTFIARLLDETPGVWARQVLADVGGKAHGDRGWCKVSEAAAWAGAAGFVLHSPGHYTAIRGADLVRADSEDPQRHHLHTVDSIPTNSKPAVAGQSRAGVEQLLREKLRTGHDVIVVGFARDSDDAPSERVGMAGGIGATAAGPAGGRPGTSALPRPAAPAGGRRFAPRHRGRVCRRFVPRSILSHARRLEQYGAGAGGAWRQTAL